MRWRATGGLCIWSLGLSVVACLLGIGGADDRQCPRHLRQRSELAGSDEMGLEIHRQLNKIRPPY